MVATDSPSVTKHVSPSIRRTGISASVYLFLEYLTVAMSGPIFTQLILERKCKTFGLDVDHCHAEVDGVLQPDYLEAHAAAASFMSQFFLCTGVLQVLTCASYGVLGDAFGRRWPLMMPLIGSSLTALSVVVVPEEQTGLLLIVCFFFSALGGQYVTNQTAMATLADVSPTATPQERSTTFSVVEGCLYSALLIGPILSGVLADAIGSKNTFLVIAAIAAVNALITCLTYRETLVPECRQPFTCRRANPVASLGMFAHSGATLCLGGVVLGGLLAQTGGISVMMLYAKQVADFTVLENGLQVSALLGSCFVGLIFVMPVLVKFMRLPKLMTLSLSWQVLVWLLMSMARTRLAIFVILGSSVLNALYFPVIRAGFTNIFGKQRYGEALAAVGTLEQVADMTGKVAFTMLYSATDSVSFKFAGLTVGCMPFLVSSCIALLGAISSLFLREMPENMERTAVKEPLKEDQC